MYFVHVTSQPGLKLISEVTKSVYSVISSSLSSLFYPQLCTFPSFSVSLFVPVCFYQCVSLHLCLRLPCWVSHCIAASLSFIFLYLPFSHYLSASLYPSVVVVCLFVCFLHPSIFCISFSSPHI